MGTVEQGDLALVIGFLAGYEEYVQSGLVGGELGGNLCRGLDDPKVEDFSLYYEAVLIADALQDRSGR